MTIRIYTSIITLNAPTKRHRLAEWIKKPRLYICCLQNTHFRSRDTYRMKVRGWKKVFHADGNQKKAGVVIISNKINTRDKEGHYIMIKGINPRVRCNNCKYICIHHRNTSIYKANTN